MTKRNDEAWFRSSTRQNPAAIVILFVRFLRLFIRAFFPLILVFALQLRKFYRPEFLWGFLGLAIIAIVAATLHYYRFHFLVDDRYLKISSGVLRRKKLDIPFDRIQNIEFEENVLHQVLDVVRLKVDTAGSASEEFSFHALKRAQALELRDYILKDQSVTVSDQANSQQNEKNLIQKLSLLDIVKVGVSQNHFRTFGIIVAFIIGLQDDVGNLLGDEFVNRAIDSSESLIMQGGWMLFRLLLLAFGLIFIGTIIYTFFRYFDFKWLRTRSGFIVEAGLLNRKEQTALLEKIQIVQWIRGPLKRLFGIGTLKFRLASSTEVTARKSFQIPGTKPDNYEFCQQIIFGSLIEAPFEIYKSAPQLLYRRWLFIWFLPSVALATICYFQHNWWLWLVLGIFMVYSFVYQIFYCRLRRYCVQADLLKIRSGVFEQWEKPWPCIKYKPSISGNLPINEDIILSASI